MTARKNGRATVGQLLAGLILAALLVGAVFPLHASASESQDISFEIAITSEGDEGGFGKGGSSTEQPNVEPRAFSFFKSSVIRDGNTEQCEFFIIWSGFIPIGGLRFKKAEIFNSGSLNSTRYALFRNSTGYATYNVAAATAGTRSIGGLIVPPDVKKVRVEIEDFQSYSLSSASWLSAIISDHLVLIN